MAAVALIGNTACAIGAGFPEPKDQLPAVRKAGGYTVEGDA